MHDEGSAATGHLVSLPICPLPHELDKSLRDCAAQNSAEEVCRFQEKADQFPTPYEGVEVKLRFPISGELRFSRQCGRPWTLPCAPAETMRALVARFSRGLGREIKLLTMPRIPREMASNYAEVVVRRQEADMTIWPT
jgi:hypothetical protein